MAGAQEQALQYYTVQDPDQSRKSTLIYLTTRTREKIQFDKKHKFTMLTLNQLEDTFESARVHTTEKANKGTI